ncbi:thyroglobulin-like [Sparus aurata]|uniref:thyroglobulin-like n=1 Tax=Sparus aurata TaxID=8175 RepID=UPI0011C12604|nr:thyroglobulin-like [Sparus aurata]XP_030249433.1 thyroglobulin-like [Sparus aurata]XP_030249434.1 thyroglobulin-like [Sparus aurata]XP_030249435.1 thyroglobulin-like [Sparus aurata]
MAWLLHIACILVCCPQLLQGKASEYQLESESLSQCELLRGVAVAKQQGDTPHCMEDGRFRPVQCSGRGQECWCVDAEGREVVGTRSNASAPHCASPCQLQSVLQCSPSGLFESVQCDSSRGQCWCVDHDGMELYGTRQTGTPPRCPGSCEVRSRRLLHSSASHSPPQCDDDGSFLPVQCRFINMTDRRELDLLHAFNRFPEAFETFSSFRKFFPMVSSYCFCSDSRGRELENTGVELLLSEVYDSAFSGLRSGRSVSQTNIYRVLQRRMLGVRLALTGHFRCPSPCEEERRAATEASSVFIPSCDSRGSFTSRQCQQGGQCWCVDPTGSELPGTRQHGDSLVCSSGLDCPSQRRLALSRLFSGPIDPSFRASSGRSLASCLPLLRPLSEFLPVEADPTSLLSHLVEVLQGLFPSVGGALEALARSSPPRLQENLFGGKFLKNAASFNFSGAVGTQGALGVDRLSSQRVSLQKNRDLVQSVSRALEDPAFLSALQHTLRGLSRSQSLDQVLTPLLRSCSGDQEDDAAAIFVPRCTSSGGFQEVQCRGEECWCVDPRGQEVSGSRTAGRQPQCPSRCERQRAMALKVKGNMAAGAVIHIPACSEDGDFLTLQCVGARCFCVDAEGKTMTAGSAGGAVTCPDRTTQKLQSSAGRCSEALAEVTAFRQEVKSIIALSNSTHLPLGYGFLLAEGLRLTPEELQTSQSEEELQISDRLLSRSKAALRLAAFSTVQMFLPPQRRSYEPFTPQCDADGHWLHTQCYHSTGQCWCVDEDGEYIPDSLTSRSLQLPKCLTRCQRAQAHSLLSGWMKGSDHTTASSYKPVCEEDGRFSVLQTGGAAGWCVNPLTGETIQAATRSAAGQLTCPSWCQLQSSQCRPDGSFLPLQCDVTSCWCTSDDGQEVGGTRTPRQTGQTPSCDRPLCPASAVTHGALVCRPAANGRQSCDLICHHGYQNSLPFRSFLCETESLRWVGDSRLLSGACQISQPLQSLSSSQLWSLSSSCSQISSLQSLLFSEMTSRGLCSAQLPSSGRSVSLCDDSSVRLQCVGDNMLQLTVTLTAHLSDLPTSDLPDLHDVGLFLNESRLVGGVRGLLGNVRSMLTSEPDLVSVTTPSFGCSRGYHLDSEGEGCVVCPAGSFSREGACLLCPQGTYQDEEGRDFCNQCPRGSSPAGASSVNQCVTRCQRRGLRCSEQGDFLPAQPDFLSGMWRCVTSEGEELDWTNSDKPLTDEECSVLGRFQAVPGSDVIVDAEDAEVLQTMSSDLTACVRACAAEPTCHHVALFNTQTQCELYSTHTLNTHCNASQQTSGFLGNPQAELYDSLSCALRVRGGASDLLVIRKKGAEFSSRQQQSFERMTMLKAVSGVFRTQVFSSTRTSLSDAHRFCQDGCSRDTCCDGFILNQNSLNGGSLLCGWLRAPSVLMCGDQDWDVTGQGTANRICGAGLTYNEQQKSFVFNFGGQKFTITDAALPADSKNKKDYQASIISFQAVYLNTDAESAADGPTSSSCAAAELSPPLDVSVQQQFESLSEDDVLVDPQRKLLSLSFWLNKKNYNSQQALLWCLSRCDEEPLCSIADLRDADSAGFFSCSLFPDTRVCGAYDKPLRRPCRPLLDRTPSNTHSKKVSLSGPVKSFYERVSFQKMVSYSVRSRVSLGENTLLSEGFMDCERRCDVDPCCRGIGFVRDTKSAGGSDVVCLSLISLGVQTCGEDDLTSWRTQDCSPSVVKTTPEPFGWYQKPVNQWSSSPALCPPFSLPTTNNVSLDQWTLLSDSSVLVDPSVSMYDVIHLSRDITSDRDKTRDWCLHACQEAESCVAVSLSEAESATRCVLYPDTTACGLSSTPSSSSPASSCRLVIREPAPQVYMRTERLPTVTSVSIPGHGMLQGVAMETALGSDRKTVVQFLGVPYAHPPIGSLRFEAAQPADWTGTWDASKPRPSCIQPGDVESAASSEDCLYLNIFTPAALTGRVPVLVFFFNPSANQSPGLLDGSTLAAAGHIVVVTASYRTAALGFLSTGSPGLPGNYGLSDQEAVLRWVNAHISLVGGDNSRVTVGAERRGADITSLHLSSSSSPLFQRMMLMGGSVFSPSLLQTPSISRQQAVDLARELGCDLTDLDKMAACLRATPVHTLNAAQTKLLAVSGPFQSWSPVRQSGSQSFHRVDLLQGTSEHDGLIDRARRIKDFEALQGRADGKTAFYEALSRSLGGATGSDVLKEAAAWFYSLDHSPSAAGYNLFSRALNNATRDLFIICPSLQMVSHWANSKANVFLYHQPASSAHDRADVSVPLDVQFVFGTPHHPMSSQRFTPSDRRLSLAMMTYVSSFIRTGDPNPSRMWAESVLPRWQQVQSSDAPPTYLELSPALRHRQGLSQNSCSFWNQLGTKLTRLRGELGAEPVQPTLTPVLPVAAPSSQSQTEKDAYS